jgi:hypothetical protein
LDRAWIFLGRHTLHISATDLILSSPPAALTRITADAEPAWLNLDSAWIRAPLAFTR